MSYKGRQNFEEELVAEDAGKIIPVNGDPKEYITQQAIENVKVIRQFDTGATRDVDDNKYDYEGFLSPLVIEAYGEYMHKHRKQTDGKLRDSDNWQKGIPRKQYMKSLWRHFMQLWMLHRGYTPVLDEKGNVVTFKDALAGILFNTMGYFHEYLKESDGK